MPTPFLPSGRFGRARLRIDPLGAAQNPDAPPQAPDLVALAEQSFARPQREAPDPRSGQADDDAADHAGDAPKFGAAPASARRTLRGHGAQAPSSAVDGADKPAASPDAQASFSVAAPAAQQQAAKTPVRPAEKTTDQHLDDYLALSQENQESQGNKENQEGAAESFGSIEDFVGGAQRLGAIRDWAEWSLQGEEQALARQALTRRPDRAGLPAVADIEQKFTNATDPALGPVDPAAVLRAPAYLNPEMMVLGGAALSKDPSLRAAHAEKLANRPIFLSPSRKRSELQASQAVLRGELTTPARKLGDASGQARVVKARGPGDRQATAPKRSVGALRRKFEEELAETYPRGAEVRGLNTTAPRPLGKAMEGGLVHRVKADRDGADGRNWRNMDERSRGTEAPAKTGGGGAPFSKPADDGDGALNLSRKRVERIGPYIPKFNPNRRKPSPHSRIRRPGKIGVNHLDLGQVLIDVPKDEIPKYDPEDKHTYHEYEHIDVVYVGSDYDPELMWEAFLSYPAPGTNGQPIESGDETDVKDPVFGLIGGPVLHGVNPKTRTITNTTGEDHSFHAGSVQRTLVFTDRGVFVYTLGRGNNLNSLLAPGDSYVVDDFNESALVVYGTWDTINAAMRRKYHDLLRRR